MIRVLSFLGFLAIPALLGALLFDVVAHGLSHINWNFLVTEPSQSGRSGGIAPIILSTLWIVGIAIIVALPLSLASAIFLSEFTKRKSRRGTALRKSIETLAGVPSIVFGLFGNAFFCVFLGMGFSILSGGLTLACMALPIMIRTIEESIRSVPLGERHGMSALGMTQTASLYYLIIPMALPGLVIGTLLGFGRAIAETAALIFTSGYVDRMPESIHDSGRALSVHIYDLAMNIPGGDQAAYATSLILVGILLSTSFVFHGISGYFIRKRSLKL